MRRQAIWAVAAAAITLLAACGIFRQQVMNACCASEYRRFSRPDGRFTVVVYRTPQMFAMPGGAGDAPGFVRLEDQRGRTLQQQDVEMVQTVETVDWQPREVYIKLFATWELPQR